MIKFQLCLLFRFWTTYQHKCFFVQCKILPVCNTIQCAMVATLYDFSVLTISIHTVSLHLRPIYSHSTYVQYHERESTPILHLHFFRLLMTLYLTSNLDQIVVLSVVSLFYPHGWSRIMPPLSRLSRAFSDTTSQWCANRIQNLGKRFPF